GMGERAEVAGPVVLANPSELKAGPAFLRVDLDEEEALVVAEDDIVLGAVFLDQLSFQEDRLGLVADDVVLEIPDAGDEGPGFVLRQSLSGGGEVMRQAFAEVPRLADVDDGAQTILV